MKLCTQLLSQPADTQSTADLDHSTQQQLCNIVRIALLRAQRWRPPPNRSPADFAEELEQVAFLAGMESIRSRSRGPLPLGTFAYQHILSSMRTWYRKEWRFGQASAELPLWLEPELNADCDYAASQPASLQSRPDEVAVHNELRLKVSILPQPQRTLLIRIYWLGSTEVIAAKALGVSQCVINQRKQTVLRELHKYFSLDDSIATANGGVSRPLNVMHHHNCKLQV